MKKLLTALFMITLSLVMMSSCKSGEKPIVIGAKDYTEQDILGNILQILVEENTSLQVEYKHEMSSNVVFAAIKSGDIDLYVDYTGTVYGNYLNYSEMKSSDEVYNISVSELKEQFGLLMLKPLGFNNTYTLSVSKDTAEKYGLESYSDLAKVSHELVLGATFEILNRNDGIPNLKKEYNMSFKDEKALDGTLRYLAMESGEVQVTDAFSTDGMLVEYELVVLEDDKGFFPPYHAAPIINEKTAEKYPELLTVIDKLADILDEDTMRELNYRVDVLKEAPKDVAYGFLRDKGLI